LEFVNNLFLSQINIYFKIGKSFNKLSPPVFIF
jgi:hypothetical protein